MKLIIFGATGSVGRPLIQQALEPGHQVTAFARDPAKIETRHDNLEIFQGDVLNLQNVKDAVQGHDAVLCSIGAGRRGTIRSQGTSKIIQAMEETCVRRLICQSTLGVGDSRGNLNFLWKYIMFGLLLRPAYEDHIQQEDLVKKSHLDWTIVRPGAFTDGEHTSRYKDGFSGEDKSITLKISRADVADFMLKQLTDATYLHKTPGLSY